jgi:hypothetical protein
MAARDGNTDIEQLIRRWHHTIEFATAAWAEYLALRDDLPASDARVSDAYARWQAADGERRALREAIRRAEQGGTGSDYEIHVIQGT